MALILNQHITDVQTGFIALRCNCVTTRARNLARQLVKKFGPAADVYGARPRRSVDKPGTVKVMPITENLNLVAMMSQAYPGEPGVYGGDMKDSAEDRQDYFAACLNAMAATIEADVYFPDLPAADRHLVDQFAKLFSHRVFICSPGAEEKQNQESCSICLDDIKQRTLTECKHVFCRGCLDRALAVKPACPLCRHSLRPTTPAQPPMRFGYARFVELLERIEANTAAIANLHRQRTANTGRCQHFIRHGRRQGQLCGRSAMRNRRACNLHADTRYRL